MEKVSEKQVRAILEEWAGSLAVSEISALTPDASLRRYFRGKLKNHKYQSVIIMVFDSLVCPEHAGGPKLGADECYVELTRVFINANVSVPELYADLREKGVLIIEDLGDTPLMSINVNKKFEDKAFEYYKQAIEQIILIQKVKNSPQNIAHKREFSDELYLREMLECSDYLLSKNTDDIKEIIDFKISLEHLGKVLYSFEKTVVHRDFHSWNLLIDNDKRVRVIDFQDALLATKYYDIVALLNDRDTDSAIGEDLYNEIFKIFLGKIDNARVEDYLYALLQRDLKVAGRFEKLAIERNLINYRKWIPGTLRRIGRALVTLYELNGDVYILRMLDVLSRRMEFVEAGKKMGVLSFVK